MILLRSCVVGRVASYDPEKSRTNLVQTGIFSDSDTERDNRYFYHRKKRKKKCSRCDFNALYVLHTGT